MKIVSINYFNRVINSAALAAFKESAEYKAAISRYKGGWEFIRYQNEVEARFTNIVPTSEGNVNIDVDYITLDEYGITAYTSESRGFPAVLFKFANAELGDVDRELTSAEKELLESIVSEYDLTDIEL